MKKSKEEIMECRLIRQRFIKEISNNKAVPVKIWWHTATREQIVSTDIFCGSSSFFTILLALWIPLNNLLILKNEHIANTNTEMFKLLEKEGIEIRCDFEETSHLIY